MNTSVGKTDSEEVSIRALGDRSHALGLFRPASVSLIKHQCEKPDSRKIDQDGFNGFRAVNGEKNGGERFLVPVAKRQGSEPVQVPWVLGGSPNPMGVVAGEDCVGRKATLAQGRIWAEAKHVIICVGFVPVWRFAEKAGEEQCCACRYCFVPFTEVMANSPVSFK